MNSRITELKNFLRERSHQGIALAFSGGVDSSFLLSVLCELRQEKPFLLKAVMMQTVFLDGSELTDALDFTQECGAELQVFHFDPLTLPAIKNNPPDRCYHCKHRIFSEFLDYARKNGYGVLMDGTNADDLGVYRPGRRALRELGVVSPLAELGFTKAEIRKLCAVRGLKCAVRPSRPCLATRFEYGTELTPELVERTGEGEKLLRNILPENTDIRLRVQKNIARIEVPPAVMEPLLRERVKIIDGLKQLGFEFITLDLEGFRSGCYDKTEEKKP